MDSLRPARCEMGGLESRHPESILGRFEIEVFLLLGIQRGNPLARMSMRILSIRLVLIAVVLSAYLPPLLRFLQERGESARRTFVVPLPSLTGQSAPDFQTELITPKPLVDSVHVASVCETPGGAICAAWYGGSHEGARDVKIYWASRLTGDKAWTTAWTEPQVLVSRASATQDLKRPIKKVGNAILFSDA